MIIWRVVILKFSNACRILSDVKARELAENFGFEEWGRIDGTHTAVRFCTSWASTDEQMDCLINAL